MEPLDYDSLDVGHYVTWRNHDLDHPECGLWQITRLGIYDPVDKREPVGAGVKLRWICGWRMYADQKKAFRAVRELRHVSETEFSRVYGKLRARAFFKRLTRT